VISAHADHPGSGNAPRHPGCLGIGDKDADAVALAPPAADTRVRSASAVSPCSTTPFSPSSTQAAPSRAAAVEMFGKIDSASAARLGKG